MVLVIIGVVMGAVMVGTDVLRQAKGQQAFSVFVSGWRDAFSQHLQVLGRVPGDRDPPDNMINSLATDGAAPPLPLCGAAMSNPFLQNRIRIPQGRGLGQETLYVYQDSTGSPQQLSICFQTLVTSLPDPSATGWSVQVSSLPVQFANSNRHVMVISGLTAELATQMDVLIDGTVSARFGQFRQLGNQNSLSATDANWGSFDSVAGDPDSARTLVTALFEMS